MISRIVNHFVFPNACFEQLITRKPRGGSALDLNLQEAIRDVKRKYRWTRYISILNAIFLSSIKKLKNVFNSYVDPRY